MALKVKFVGALRHLSGKTQLTLNCDEDMSLKQLIENLSAQYPAIKRTFTDQTLNDAKSNSLVLINGREISVLDGYETKLRDGDEVVFVPVVHGG
jgi:sulfur-carrier protein